jgi:mediator of RNA polymerase II transcription subunit 12
VPLHRLGKSVPHGAKGGDALDLLHAHAVPPARALWFVRVFGANESVRPPCILYRRHGWPGAQSGLRSKPGADPTQYSVDWAAAATAHLKKQLAELALPAAPKPGPILKSTFRGVLLEPEPRARWVAKFAWRHVCAA